MMHQPQRGSFDSTANPLAGPDDPAFLALTKDIMPRPKAGMDYVQRRAAELMLPEIKQYLGKDARNYTDRELLADLAKYISLRNGFDIVKDMEDRSGWVGDAELVELMDNASWHLDDAIKELTKQWVICTRPPMLFAPGDAVTSDRWHDRKGQVAQVVRVDAEIATYGIRYPDQPETQYYVMEAEFLTAVPPLEGQVQ